MHRLGQSKYPFRCFKYNSAICVTEIGICALYFIVIDLFSHKLYYREIRIVKSGKRVNRIRRLNNRIGTDLTELFARADLPKSV